MLLRITITLFCLLLTLFTSIQAQCDLPSPPGDICQDAPLLCSFNGYCTSTGGFTATLQPSSFCGGVENNSWLAFLAGSETLQFQITPSNCQNNNGLQAEVYASSDCLNFTSVSNCWSPNSVTVGILTATGLTIGERYYLMMDGKAGDFCDITLQILSGTTLSPSEANTGTKNIICGPDGILTLDGSASATGAGISYEWTTSNGNIISGADTPFPIVDLPGDYQLVVVNPASGCTDTASIEVFQVSLPSAIIPNPPILDCVDNTEINLSVTISASGGTDFNYAWSTLNGNILSGANTSTPLVDKAGDYQLELTNAITGCATMLNTTVIADVNTPLANAGEDLELNCLIDTLIIDGSNSSSGNFIYTWTTNSGNIISGQNETMLMVDAAGTYSFLVTNLINGCTATDEVLIINNLARPTGAIFNIKNKCYGETDGSYIIESVLGGTAPYLFSWDGVNYHGSNQQLYIPVGEYPIFIRDSIGCEWDTIISIIEPPQLVVDLGPDVVISLGDSVQLQALINYPKTAIDSINWKPTICNDTCFEQFVQPNYLIPYTITIISEDGCMANDSVWVRVDKERKIYLPNAFSPNDDGFNDLYMIYGGLGVAKVNLFRLYNRWGGLVFEKTNFDVNDPSQGWDGRLRGKLLQEGVFIYYAEVVFTDGWVEQYKGDFVLRR